jgi:Domain of unknown function (DUF397)
MSVDNAVPGPLPWRKALRSVGNGNCVEVAPAAAGVVVRDSQDPDGLALAYNASSWRAFAVAARQGYFDLSSR